MTLSIVDSTEDHVLELIDTLREADVQELTALGMDPGHALVHSFHTSAGMRFTALNEEDQVICMFGVGSETFLSTWGVPWLLASELLDGGTAMRLCRRCRGFIQIMAGRFDLLINFVDARQETAIRWLEWLGFEIGEAEPYGPEGLPFHRFEMRREICAEQQ